MAAAKPSRPTKTKPASKQPWSARRKGVVGALIAVGALAVIAAIIFVTLASNGTLGHPSPAGHSRTSPSPTIPSTPTPTASAIPITARGTIAAGLTARITKFESVAGVAKTPGEVSAPSVRITVAITNATSSAVSLSTAVVTAAYGSSLKPALQLSSPGEEPFPASVAAGKSAQGVFIFSIPQNERGNVRIEVDYSVKIPPLVFRGAIPR